MPPVGDSWLACTSCLNHPWAGFKPSKCILSSRGIGRQCVPRVLLDALRISANCVLVLHISSWMPSGIVMRPHCCIGLDATERQEEVQDSP